MNHDIVHAALRCAALIALTTACRLDAPPASEATQPSDETSEWSFPPEVSPIEEGSPEASAMLAFLNHPYTTQAKLDSDVGLQSRAAESLVTWRASHDGLLLTADDRSYSSVAQVLEVPWVGVETVRKLVDYAIQYAWQPGADDFYGTCEGVRFTVEEASTTLRFANEHPRHQLDHDAGLDVRAVDAILEARPLATIEALAELPYIGEASLRRLRDTAAVLMPPLLCSQDHECSAGEFCTGIPSDGSSDLGQCVSPDPLPGEGERCTLDDDCAVGLVCSHAEDVYRRECLPAWSVGVFQGRGYRTHHGAGIADDTVAHGLGRRAKRVMLHLDLHVQQSQPLQVELIDPSGNASVLWSGSAPVPSVLQSELLGRQEPNGLWTLVISRRDGVLLRDWELELETTLF